MGLQVYDINIGINKTQQVAAQGRYIYYLAGSTPLIDGGTTPAAAGNQAIKCVSGSTSIVLMPGQSLRLPNSDKSPSTWMLSNDKNAETITGRVLVGEGDFRDSNTSNTNYLKLDATFANNVKVSNTAAERVPVTADLTQTIPVSIAGIVNVSEGLVSYTHKYVANTASLANTAIPMLAAATNVNGAVLEKFDVSIGAGTFFTILAKATPPGSTSDGDVLFMSAGPVGVNSLDMAKNGRIKVPAGLGIWYISQGADASPLRSALFTVL